MNLRIILSIVLGLCAAGCHTTGGTETKKLQQNIAAIQTASRASKADAKKIKEISRTIATAADQQGRSLDTADHKQAVLEAYFKWLQRRNQ
jgi:hypothetical protein